MTLRFEPVRAGGAVRRPGLVDSVLFFGTVVNVKATISVYCWDLGKFLDVPALLLY